MIRPLRRRISDLENRLRLMLCLEHTAPMTEVELWPFVASLDLMDYFTYGRLITSMLEEGWIISQPEGLRLTPSGEEALSFFPTRVAQSDREAIQHAALAYVLKTGAARVAGAVYESSVWQDSACVRGRLLDDGVPALSIRLMTWDQPIAQAFQAHFTEIAPAILHTLYSLPVPEETTAQLGWLKPTEYVLNQTLPGHPMLLSYGGPRTAGCVCLQGQGHVVSLLLLLPNREVARNWAIAADAAGEELLTQILAPLTPFLENSPEEAPEEGQT